MQHEFHTERLFLRHWKETDYKDLYEYAKLEEVGPLAGWAPHVNEAQSKDVINYFLKKADSYAIVLKEENKVIGSIGFHQRSPDPSLSHLSQREIGFALNPSYWGRELVPEAVCMFIKYGFEQMHLDLVWCGHFDFNSNSRRVTEKCGFTFQFKRQQRFKIFSNKLVTSLYYSISKEDYKEKWYTRIKVT
ncbi:GNAT family N-acetyltransferase [Bacillus sp. B1-b2]|uniref:GNAT family N-acetyltransferase n=1 Tax=Bacillus sp. B1-b2 TaxID=2653201 RepID=UPI0012620C67|nr:GNAT family N-acetyltransferase [Bacillus sp. B1-b2]KAB7673131.1 GNAT family N-acetyltransferase [Bacillus sp. B1-b2]